MNTYKITKYLNFTEISNTGKTVVVGVGNNSGEQLGYIKWIPGWRKYGFMPMSNLQFDAICLNEIIEEMQSLMDKRNILLQSSKIH